MTAVHARVCAISDSPTTCTGLALAAVASRLAYTPEELLLTLENIGPDIGVVIITSRLAARSADILERYREKNSMPLITIIPDPDDFNALKPAQGAMP